MHTSAEIVQAVNKQTLGGVSPWFGVPARCWVCLQKALSGGRLGKVSFRLKQLEQVGVAGFAMYTFGSQAFRRPGTEATLLALCVTADHISPGPGTQSSLSTNVVVICLYCIAILCYQNALFSSIF